MFSLRIAIIAYDRVWPGCEKGIWCYSSLLSEECPEGQGEAKMPLPLLKLGFLLIRQVILVQVVLD